MPKLFEDREKAAAAGRKGRPGKHKKTEQWEALAESIITTHAERFDKILTTLPDNEFAKIYKDILNYFKPKINHNINEGKTSLNVIFANASDIYNFDEEGNSIEIDSDDDSISQD